MRKRKSKEYEEEPPRRRPRSPAVLQCVRCIVKKDTSAVNPFTTSSPAPSGLARFLCPQVQYLLYTQWLLYEECGSGHRLTPGAMQMLACKQLEQRIEEETIGTLPTEGKGRV